MVDVLREIVARNRAGVATLPDPLLWQVFAPAVLDRADALSGPQVQRLIDAQIQIALDPYCIPAELKRDD